MPTPSRFPSLTGARLEVFSPPPSTALHSRVDHSGPQSEEPGVEGDALPLPRSSLPGSNNVSTDRPRVVPLANAPPSFRLLVHIKEQVSGLGGGLTISGAVGGQQDGAPPGTSRRSPLLAVLGRADRLHGDGVQAVKPRPVSPNQDWDGQILDYPHLHGPTARGGRDRDATSGDLSLVPVHTVDGQAGLRPHEADRAAGIQNGLIWPSIHLYFYSWGLRRWVAVDDAARQPCSVRGAGCFRGYRLVLRAENRRSTHWPRDTLQRASLLAHPSGKRRRSLPHLPMLGGLRQLDGLHEITHCVGVPHAGCLPECTG